MMPDFVRALWVPECCLDQVGDDKGCFKESKEFAQSEQFDAEDCTWIMNE